MRAQNYTAAAAKPLLCFAGADTRKTGFAGGCGGEGKKITMTLCFSLGTRRLFSPPKAGKAKKLQ